MNERHRGYSVSAPQGKIYLFYVDIFFLICHCTIMTLHIRKLTKTGMNYRLSIPHKVIISLGWEDVEYVIVDDRNEDIIIIRRLNYGESRKK